MAEFPSLPLFTDALVADTGHLTDEEFGAYLRLLILCWRTPGCKMPNDTHWHMRKLGVTLDKYNSLHGPLIKEFFTSTGNFVYQKRLLKEFEYLVRRNKNQSDAAKSRWKKKSEVEDGNAPTPIPKKESKESNLTVTKEIANQDLEPKKKINGDARPRGTRLAPDWFLPMEWGTWAMENFGMSKPEILAEADKFKDFWLAKPGQGGVKLDWQATWRNWIRTSREGFKR